MGVRLELANRAGREDGLLPARDGDGLGAVLLRDAAADSGAIPRAAAGDRGHVRPRGAGARGRDSAGDPGMRGKVKVWVAIVLGVFLSLSVGGVLWANRPFQAELGSYRTSLADRTDAQRHNIRQAVSALSGVVLEPGERLSFNKAVGPRTINRGYQEAPAFMERNLVMSIGGGICQVSSTLYNAALSSGLAIVERHPHFRQVQSVPPGRDATVWYGQADLIIENPFSSPVQVLLSVNNSILQVTMRALVREKIINLQSVSVRTSELGVVRYKTIRFTRRIDGESAMEIVSIDTYRVQ